MNPYVIFSCIIFTADEFLSPTAWLPCIFINVRNGVSLETEDGEGAIAGVGLWHSAESLLWAKTSTRPCLIIVGTELTHVHRGILLSLEGLS